MPEPESEWLEEPRKRPRYGWQVILHEVDEGVPMVTMMGEPSRWRWLARRYGHVVRKWSEPGSRVEIRPIRRTDAPRCLP